MEFDRIIQHPMIMNGEACVRGTQIPVDDVVTLLAALGMSAQEVRQLYPELEEEDIEQCVRYTSWMARDIKADIADWIRLGKRGKDLKRLIRQRLKDRQKLSRN